jgi:hypothetical protein
MQIMLTLPPQDPAYIEARGGMQLLSHLRGAPARVEYRRRAVQRAYDRFERGEDDGCPDAEIGGLGLIVLQRALLAAEDLGGLLHAFAGPEPWSRLRSATLPEITAAFDRVLADPDNALTETFRLATEGEIAAEGLAPAEVQLLGGIRRQIAARWLNMLRRSAELWTGSPVAKATMHGFPFVCGGELLGPPVAGVLGQNVPNVPAGRFAAALLSSSRDRKLVNTSIIPVLLDRVTVERLCTEGQSSAQLYGELCAIHAKTTEIGTRALLPYEVVEPLEPEAKEALERLVEKRQQLR